MKKHFAIFALITIFFSDCIQASATPLLYGDKGKLIFNGKTLDGWRTYRNQSADSWFVKEGMLCNKGNKDPKTQHADLITIAQYENFELSLDWKIAPQANSGILYMVDETFPASYTSGPEYQLIDDKGYPAKLEDWQKTGANYAMDAPMTDATKPAGEWNHTVIKVNKGHVEHWLNGRKVVTYELGSETWEKQKAAGKWKDHKEYGMTKKGHIAFQDHGGEAWFKNIRLKEL